MDFFKSLFGARGIYRLDSMQDITKDQPDQHNNGNPPADNLKGADTIGAIWIAPDRVAVHVEGTGIVTPRFFAAGFCRFRFPAVGFLLPNFFSCPVSCDKMGRNPKNRFCIGRLGSRAVSIRPDARIFHRQRIHQRMFQFLRTVEVYIWFDIP